MSKVVSVNAGATLGSLLELGFFIRYLDTMYPQLSLCSISELHASDNVSEPAFVCAGARIHVHHPGPGFGAMAWVIRGSAPRFVPSVLWLVHAGSIRLKPMASLF